MTQQYMFPILNHRTTHRLLANQTLTSEMRYSSKQNKKERHKSSWFYKDTKKHIDQEGRMSADSASMLISTQYYSECYSHSQKCSSPITHFQKSKRDYSSNETSESSPTTPPPILKPKRYLVSTIRLHCAFQIPSYNPARTHANVFIPSLSVHQLTFMPMPRKPKLSYPIAASKAEIFIPRKDSRTRGSGLH